MTPMIETFVMHFGEMGSRWGFNRTVGQMYALLVITENPISANEIADALSISRGNVSMGLKELQSWRLIQMHHKPGDRKEYFQTNGSIWDMANRVFEERRKREMDPTLSLLRDILLDTPANIIKGCKLLEAKRMLSNQNISIKEVAYALGFDDPTYFTKYFKKGTTYTPKEFQKAYL